MCSSDLDAERSTDLRAGDGELVVVLAVDVLDERVGIDEQANCFARDHVDRQKAVAGHRIVPLIGHAAVRRACGFNWFLLSAARGRMQ